MDNLYEWLPDILLWVTSPIWVGAAAGIFAFIFLFVSMFTLVILLRLTGN